jgi:hypothetical protein
LNDGTDVSEEKNSSAAKALKNDTSAKKKKLNLSELEMHNF